MHPAFFMCHFSFGGERGIFIRCVVGVGGVSNGSCLPGSYHVLGSWVAMFLGRSKLSKWPSEHTFSSVPSGWKANPWRGFKSTPWQGEFPVGYALGCKSTAKSQERSAGRTCPVLNQTSINLSPSLQIHYFSLQGLSGEGEVKGDFCIPKGITEKGKHKGWEAREVKRK